ncbi:hypothetical protein [Collinsella tanakaei]|uniref:hypothetical protein n=1 Tax=Collinsella tanakaei TaxID=626935 RepID=UPI0022E68AD8|nr:hypothetical protein [Collinsella tanakaei]
MSRFLTDEQAAYLSQLYTGTEVPEMHHAPAAYVRRLERTCTERGMTIQQLCRTIHGRNKRIAELEKQETYLIHRLGKRIDELEKSLMLARRRGETIHKLERKLSRANRKHAALHRAMHEDTRRVFCSLKKAVDCLAQSIVTPSPVEEGAYGAAWPRFADGAPVVIGDFVKGVMCDVEVASIVFRADCIVLYDSQMFHYVKLDGGETAQRPDGTRLALD